LKESFKIYCALNDGIINLVDMVVSIYHDLIYHLIILFDIQIPLTSENHSSSIWQGMMQWRL